ncbi:MAG: riboflavin biosynthesis protein RibF [Ferrimicrobium sp.]|jgi:riboflavin kinase/FMN adenylyltransferase|nr:riboflavin biosynthesis protein RibF [Ferrimicrobium sp.]
MIEVVSSTSPAYSLAGSVVTIGSFDGFHRGHLQLIQRAGEAARERGLPLVVVTFDRHPLQVLAPERAPRLLMGPIARRQLLESLGVDVLYLLHFDRERAAQSPTDFVEQVLVVTLGAQVVFVGENFTYGAKGAGTVETLGHHGRQRGFLVHVQPLITVGEVEVTMSLQASTPISATLIRTLVREGRIEEANTLLGHPFGLEGTVVTGDQRGRTLGFPTANVSVQEDYVKPPDAVYAGMAMLDGRRYPLAISLGTRPMYYPEGGVRLLEVFVIGYDGDLYQQRMVVYFLARLREQQVFDSEAMFRQQMELDVDQARRLGERWPS